MKSGSSLYGSLALTLALICCSCTTNNIRNVSALSLIQPKRSLPRKVEHAADSSRRSLFLSSAALIVGSLTTTPSVARADGAAPAPAPPKPAPAPAPAPPKPSPPKEEDPKVKAEIEAKLKVAKEIAEAEAKLKEKALALRKEEEKCKLRVERITKQKTTLEARIKVYQEARKTAEKVDVQLKDTGDRSNLDSSLKKRQEAVQKELKDKQKRLKTQLEKQKKIRAKRLELEAIYKIKVGKEMVLPPMTVAEMNSITRRENSDDGPDITVGDMEKGLLTVGAVALGIYAFGQADNDDDYDNYNDINRRRSVNNRSVSRPVQTTIRRRDGPYY